jgi:hypothetical protein
MPRGQLPKAYLRIDPDIDAKHPDNLAELIRLLCAANRQPRRGVFRSRVMVEALLGKGPTKRLVERGDLREIDGAWTVGGWDHWQEGNLDVAERMRRIRAERDNKPRTNGAHSAHSTDTDSARLVAPTPKASGNKASDDDDPQTPDEIELLADDLLAPHTATPRQLRALRGFVRLVGHDRTLEVMAHWVGQKIDDRFSGAFEQLQAEADEAKAGKRKPNEFAYLDEQSKVSA